MNKTNYFKTFAFLAFAFLLNTTVYAQNSQGKMERQQAQPRVAQTGVTKVEEEAKTVWLYTVMQVNTKDNKVEVVFEQSNPQPKTTEEKTAFKMAIENQSKFKESASSFTSETDVLNYLSQKGYELVSVVPNGKEGTLKTFYLRSKLPE